MPVLETIAAALEKTAEVAAETTEASEVVPLPAGDMEVLKQLVRETKEFPTHVLNENRTLPANFEMIRGHSLESLKEINESSKATEINISEYRPLTEEEVKRIQEATGMSDATIERCTINKDGEIRISCINEDKLGEATNEAVYKEKVVEINGEKIRVVMPEFKDVKFETQLPSELTRASDTQQFEHCTEQLREAIKNDPELAKQFTPQQLEQIQNGAPRISGMTWHHCAESGKMQLVPSSVHSTYRHTGGKAIWGGGRP